MDKSRNEDTPERMGNGPGLQAPDYFSLVIEWDHDADELAASRTSREDLDPDLADEITEPHIRHWDVVDEASAESFPASDPPAWMGSSGHAAPTEASAAAGEATVEAQEVPETRIRRLIGKIAVGVAAIGVMVHWLGKLRRRYATT